MSDVFSLGVICYEILTGTLPFGRGARVSSLDTRLNPQLTSKYKACILDRQNPMPMSQDWPPVGESLNVPEAVEAFVLRALGPRDARFADAGEMCVELQSIIDRLRESAGAGAGATST
mmetsp:Transcript_6888/g.21521  ORF Transcript_6888/g.21521 Transcript_6888/m.21521 type:complete len:118 (+) Transcript_6888:2582-2935(+)